MDKNSNHEERDKMQIPQKKEETTFMDFVTKNKEIIHRIAKSNTVINKSGLTVIPKDDPWLDEEEWDAMHKDLRNK